MTSRFEQVACATRKDVFVVVVAVFPFVVASVIGKKCQAENQRGQGPATKEVGV